jgi:hypothetical protein
VGRRYKQRYVFGAMLSVAVQRDDDIGTAGERGSKTGPQRRRLAAVDLVSQQRHRQSFEREAGSVGRTIVDDDDRVALLQRTPGNVPYRSSFVESRDDDRCAH